MATTSSTEIQQLKESIESIVDRLDRKVDDRCLISLPRIGHLINPIPARLKA